MISIDHVSFGYGEAQETLSQVSAAIAPGECVLLCGTSGCGKTTVTKLLNGLIPAFTPGCRLEGRVEVDGLDPGTTPMYKLARKVGSVFQNPKSQFFNLDTDSELAFGLENEGRPPEEIRRRVADTVDALHLQELQGRSIFSLSGGQKQLLAFGPAGRSSCWPSARSMPWARRFLCWTSPRPIWTRTSSLGSTTRSPA